MKKSNMLLRQNQVRRFVYHLGIFTIVLLILSTPHFYYNENFSNPSGLTRSIPPYNEYINQIGEYLPYSGYKILQFVNNQLSKDLRALYIYLDEEYELKLYFKLVPTSAYHITLTNLKNKTLYEENHLKILSQEQELLDQNDTSLTCVGEQFLIIDKYEIRLKIEVIDFYFTDFLKQYQKRWNENFLELITQHYTSFYITIAHQYKDIPDKDTFTELEKTLTHWDLVPIYIRLHPIEICSYENLISYTALLPDDTIH